MIRLVPHVLDLGSRKFWQLAGRQVDLDGRERWLDAPVSRSPRVSEEWLAAEAARHGGVLGGDEPDAGLLASMALLDGPGFESERLRPEVRDFYEHTAAWHVEVWSGVVSRLLARGRAGVPALGATRRAARPADAPPRGRPRHGQPGHPDPRPERRPGRRLAWNRTLRGSGRPVFSGAYSARTLPGADRPSVHVAFPLESGNVQVFLRPTVTDDGGLLLESPTGRFGQDGAYVVVRDRRAHAARVPLHETFHVYVDADGVLRTDHELRLWSASAVRLHYKLERVP